MEHWTKKRLVELKCTYGSSHFCDGTPNLSVAQRGKVPKALPPCPYRLCCELKNSSVFDEQEN